MTAATPASAESRLTSDQAMLLLVELLKCLFAHNIPTMKQTPVKRRFEKDLFEVLHLLQRDPDARLDGLPTGVQRLVYEMLTQYIMMYAQSPGLPLAVSVRSGMNDVEKLSALLQQEVIPRSWPYPQSVPL